MKIVIDLEKLTLDDLISLEDGANYKTLRQIVGRFVVDEQGQAVSEAEAVQFAGRVTLAEMRQVNEGIREALSGRISPEAGGG